MTQKNEHLSVPIPTKLEVAQQLWRRYKRDKQGKRHWMFVCLLVLRVVDLLV